jgi:DNA gyrase subunit B
MLRQRDLLEQLREASLSRFVLQYPEERFDIDIEEDEEAVGEDGRMVYRKRLSSYVNGIRHICVLSQAMVRRTEFQQLDREARSLRSLGRPAFSLQTKQGAVEVMSVEGIAEKLLEMGQKGCEIQRYKGLGEMNPEQLWETTMDPQHRSLLQVHLQDLEKADEIFTVLMGDQVEPRKFFIESNALRVRNLDV